MMLLRQSSLNSRSHSDAYWNIVGNPFVYKKLEQKTQTETPKHEKSFQVQLAEVNALLKSL